METLPNAVVLLSEILGENQHIESDLARCRSLWMRGECLQRWGIYAEGIGETLSAFRQAEQDFRAAVESSPDWFAGLIPAHHWFPENSFLVPAYVAFLDGLGEPAVPAQGNAIQALKNIGMEASSALPSLRSVRGAFRQWAENAIQRITAIETGEKLPFRSIRQSIEGELRTDQDRIPEEHVVTDEDVELPEWELLNLLNAQHWATRAKGACILRFTVAVPDKSVVQVLFRLLESDERGIVRGQCARTLGHYALKGVLGPDNHERLLRVLIARLESDSAYPVRGIAADVLSSESGRPEVQACLTEIRSLVVGLQPHRLGTTGEVIRAAAILRLTPPGQRDDTGSMNTLIESLRTQPFARLLEESREVRQTALAAVLTVPMLGAFRKKLLLDRMVFDDSAEIRAEAAQVLIRLDGDLATQAGAFAVLRRLGQ